MGKVKVQSEIYKRSLQHLLMGPAYQASQLITLETNDASLWAHLAV